MTSLFSIFGFIKYTIVPKNIVFRDVCSVLGEKGFIENLKTKHEKSRLS